MGDEKVIL